MDSIKILVQFIMDVVTSIFGNSEFSDTVLLAPFVFWILRQVTVYLKILLRSSYKRW